MHQIQQSLLARLITVIVCVGNRSREFPAHHMPIIDIVSWSYIYFADELHELRTNGQDNITHIMCSVHVVCVLDIRGDAAQQLRSLSHGHESTLSGRFLSRLGSFAAGLQHLHTANPATRLLTTTVVSALLGLMQCHNLTCTHWENVDMQ